MTRPHRSALVTGGAGFIGSHVAERLAAEGYAVTVLDDFSTGKREHIAADTALHECDIRSEDAAHFVRASRFDVICHLAAQIDVRKSVGDPSFDADVNVRGTLNLLEAVRASGHPTRFIFSSTGGAIYGDAAELPTPETAAKTPESPYGVAKLAVEYYLAYYARVHGADVVALRYANVYGPRQDPHGEAGVVAIFCNRLLDDEPLTVFGDGNQTRDYVFVEDVARANVLAASREIPAAAGIDARAFNIGTTVQTTVLDLANMLADAAGVTAVMKHEAARPGEQRHSAIAIDKSERVLGWQPLVDIRDGLRATLQSFAAQREASGP